MKARTLVKRPPEGGRPEDVRPAHVGAGTAAPDATLVNLALLGSADAFGSLVERYHVAVIRFAYRFAHDAQDADDIAQDTFFHAYRSLGTLGSDRPFKQWLFAIARNASLDAVRRRSVAARNAAMLSQQMTSSPDIDAIVFRNEDAAKVRAALTTLPPRHRAALELHYMRGLRYREISRTLDTPLGTVKTYIARGKAHLRTQLNGEILTTTRASYGA